MLARLCLLVQNLDIKAFTRANDVSSFPNCFWKLDARYVKTEEEGSHQGVWRSNVLKVANRATNFCLQPLLPNFVRKKIKASKYLLTLGFYIHADNQNFAQNIVTVHPFCIAAVRCDSKYGFFFSFSFFWLFFWPVQHETEDSSAVTHHRL